MIKFEVTVVQTFYGYYKYKHNAVSNLRVCLKEITASVSALARTSLLAFVFSWLLFSKFF